MLKCGGILLVWCFVGKKVWSLDYRSIIVQFCFLFRFRFRFRYCSFRLFSGEPGFVSAVDRPQSPLDKFRYSCGRFGGVGRLGPHIQTVRTILEVVHAGMYHVLSAWYEIFRTFETCSLLKCPSGSCG